MAAAQALVAQRSAELRNAQSTEQRAIELTKQKLISKQSAETAATDARNRGCGGARRAGESGTGAPAHWARPARRTPRCARRPRSSRRRNLDLAHTRITAPASGLIANFEVRPGSMVQERRAALHRHRRQRSTGWTRTSRRPRLRRIMPGQKARIVVDMYPKHQNSRAWCRACRAAPARRSRCCRRRTRPATGSR